MIRKHARLHGAIQAQERKAGEMAAALERQLQGIREARISLGALEKTLAMHEIIVDTSDIAPVRPRRPNRESDWRYGELGRRILASLRRADGWLRTSEVLESITGNTPENTVREEYEHLRRLLRRRLHGLHARGKVERQQCKDWSGTDQRHNQTLWRLPCDPSSEAQPR